MTSQAAIHRKILSQICERLDQDPDSPKCREMMKHLEGCPECTAYLKSLRSTVSLYRRYRPPPLSAESRKKLRKVLGLA